MEDRNGTGRCVVALSGYQYTIFTAGSGKRVSFGIYCIYSGNWAMQEITTGLLVMTGIKTKEDCLRLSRLLADIVYDAVHSGKADGHIRWFQSEVERIKQLKPVHVNWFVPYQQLHTMADINKEYRSSR